MCGVKPLLQRGGQIRSEEPKTTCQRKWDQKGKLRGLTEAIIRSATSPLCVVNRKECEIGYKRGHREERYLWAGYMVSLLMSAK